MPVSNEIEKPTKVPPFRKHIAGLDQSSLNSFFAYVTKSYTQTDQKSSDTKQKKLRRHSGQGFKAFVDEVSCSESI